MALYQRDLNVPRRPPPPPPTSIPKASPLTLTSKLPRRIATPPATPPPRTPASKWLSSVADRVASVEKSTVATKRKDSTMTPQPSPKVDEYSKDKPLPSQKPLPSRPIARLSNSLSPTKDGRCLIDASEPPLHITSVAGEKHDWPTLRPQSVNLTPKSTPASSENPSTDFTTVEISESECTITSAVTDATAALSKVLDRTTSCTTLPAERSSSSPPSSYASASENSPPEEKTARGPLDSPKRARRSTASIRSPRKSVLSTGIAPMRKSPTRRASLQRPASEESMHDVPIDDSSQPLVFEDSNVKTTSPNKPVSRPQSPSPTNFSRPRPSSASKSMKTASRIPIPDSKKATVIDVKKNRLSTSTVPKTVPSFGSRRLASPDALKILENGKMRRQLKRMPTDASLQRTRAEHMWETESNATVSSITTPSLSHSIDTSPEATVAASSPETTPFPPAANAKGPEGKAELYEHEPLPAKQPTFYDSSTADEGFDTDGYYTDTSFTQSPPSTSPFTLPLQTIPSEALLPVNNTAQQPQHYNELVRALSHLEGKGSPPKTDVDPQTLLQLFGHVRRELGTYPQDTMALAEHAAVAEKYLARNPSVLTHSNIPAPVREVQVHGEGEEQNQTQAFRDDNRETLLVSKWSDSTPSDKALSPNNDTVSPIRADHLAKSRQSVGRSKVSSNGTISIGYPSCRRYAASNEPAVAPPSEAASPPTVHRRRSSPTLGGQINHAKPGSVRAAREGIQAATASFAHMTASTAAKKAPRMPTPNTKPFDAPETKIRRKSSMRKSRATQTNGASPKTPRSQSKSRFVLDKINGIFSGKRDRKSQDMPPLPYRIDGRVRYGSLKTVTESGHATPITSTPELNRLPKMPSFSPYGQHPHARSASNQSMTSDSGMEDGLGDSQSVGTLAMRILEKAKKEKNSQRKARLLNFAKVLNDALISVREAQISAETAQHAAKNAQMSYEMTLKSLVMLQKLASPIARSGQR